MKAKNTSYGSEGDAMIDELLESEGLDAWLEANAAEPEALHGYLQGLLEEKGLRQAAAVRMADIGPTYGYQIFVGSRMPSRDKVLRLAFAMGLGIDEAQRALELAGVNALRPDARRDAIVVWCLGAGMSLQRAQEELWERGEATLH